MKRFAALGLFAVVISACTDSPTSSASPALAVQPAARSSAPIGTPIPGHYIVVFKNNGLKVAAMASTIATQHHTTIEHTYTSAIQGVALPLSDVEADAMRADPNVAYVEQDQVVKLQSTQANAPWGLDRTDQRALPLNTTYVSNADGTGVTVYIMDTGINYSHVDFEGRAVPGADFVTPSLNGNDCIGHGTGVASVVGGATYGVAKNVRLVSLRVADCNLKISSSRVIAAIDWIATHPSLPSVVNMSMQLTKSTAVTQAVQNSSASGVVYVVAAGNTADDACGYSPSNVPAAITVGATDGTDHFASFSSFGSCVDINAPGVGIPMAWMGSTTATHSGGGTSFSSPHVAGVAALYLQANRTATPAQVSSALVANATANALTSVPANTPNRLVYSGFISLGAVPPVANFTTSCPALTCGFDGSSSTAQPTATYGWTFGDATSGSGKTPSHRYATAGTYTVTLTVTDANGTSTRTKSVTVAAANQPPVARFTVTCPTLQCTFNGSTSTDDVGVVSYAWAWGDGRTETHSSAISSNSYAAAGTYSVTLTVTDGSGQTNSVTTPVQVPGSTNHAPTASITSPSSGATFVQGTSVSFAGTGRDPEDGTLTGSSLTWTSSRDGQIGTGTSFSKNNLSVGSHVLTLTARDAQGMTGTTTSTITISAPANQAPVARFTWTCGAPGSRSCTVNGSSSTDDVAVASYTWAWGNGKSETHVGSTSANTWSTSGTFNVTLTVKDGSGLASTVTHAIAVP